MEPLLDARNEALWKQLNENYTIELKPSLNGEYGCYSQGKEITFFINESNPCLDSFTHELLHVYLRLNDLYVGAGLKNTIAGSNILKAVFSEPLLEHIGNSLDHIKMLPLYLEMGFDREKFLLDYHTDKCLDAEVKQLKQYYKTGKNFNLKIVDNYLGKLFAVFADPNPAFTYSLQKEQLKKIDPFLYSATQKMVNHWKKVEISAGDGLSNTYHEVVYSYYQDLKKWVSLNKVTR